MIAQIVFDLPVEGPFDYAIPTACAGVAVGMRVKAPFGSRIATGFVVGLSETAAVEHIKEIKKIQDPAPVFDARDIDFAGQFGRYYGCTLGEALAIVLRQRLKPLKNCLPHPQAPITLHHVPDGNYKPIIQDILKDQPRSFVLVPDSWTAETLGIENAYRSAVGLRSWMFNAFVECACIVVIDEDHPLYKQEQSPMYETRQVLLMARQVYGFDLVFITATPSVELMNLVREKACAYNYITPLARKPASVVDTSNYKFLEKGLLSPAARRTIQDNALAGRKTIVIINRRGSFSVTRCTQCGHVLKCPHCDSALTYSRIKKSMGCRHCSFTCAPDVPCPVCQKPSWKSFGMGVEQVHKEMIGLFPQASIACFQGEDKDLPGRFDVLIATQALLRFKGRLMADTVICLDFDEQLSRLDMRSSFNAWALAMRLRHLGRELIVQTKNRDHYVMSALSKDDAAYFYDHEMAMRRDLQFAPFFHWVALIIRGKIEKNSKSYAQEVYNKILEAKTPTLHVQEMGPDVPAKLRDQFRFRIMVGAPQVAAIAEVINASLKSVKRSSRVIVTRNIDP